ARVWVQVRVNAATLPLPRGSQLVTQFQAPGIAPPLLRDRPALQQGLAAGAEVFETMHDVTLRAAHNRLSFHTWGDREGCLPRGATAAPLLGRLPAPRAGPLLVCEEVLGPLRGGEEDADPGHRHAVRLTRVTPAQDLVGTPTEADPDPPPVDVTEVEWAAEDALPFALCLSA